VFEGAGGALGLINAAQGLDEQEVAGKGVVFRHGPIFSSTKFEVGLDDVEKWLKVNPSELVVLFMQDYDDKGVVEVVNAIFQKRKIKFITSKECAKFKDKTVFELRTLTGFKEGLIAVAKECAAANFDQSVSCMEGGNEKEVCPDCWSVFAGKDFKTDPTWKRYADYVDRIAPQGLGGGKIAQVLQTSWQLTGNARIGIDAAFNVLLDEDAGPLHDAKKSDINAKTMEHFPSIAN
jgi:hypothetical protein